MDRALSVGVYHRGFGLPGGGWFQVLVSGIWTLDVVFLHRYQNKCSATWSSVFSGLYLVRHITSDLWNTGNISHFYNEEKYPATMHFGASTVNCESTDVANLIHLSILQFKFKNVGNDQNWGFSCHAAEAMKHLSVSIFTLIASIFRPAFFKPPWAELQILDHQACHPDYLTLSDLGDKSWLQRAALLIWGAAVKAILKKTTWCP